MAAARAEPFAFGEDGLCLGGFFDCFHLRDHLLGGRKGIEAAQEKMAE